ncbi:PhzF family phenazine biosynthesis protein [Cupriavidus plantarum]|uniref:PhzF family phenazine biosynthesis protein n=1 Tax=Cupriavidus plantarum TaxID=942865 RepID=UPI000EAD9E1C|nr:PhzF family phenazine biosynthesis protein [Cupriavidus plantarum]RLK35403.1 PhzF family phenazine biosynthesis protein [Cupriavidus plantarum]CAG2127604.1 putative isomerase YddE [Cupriavidus plantarum]SMR67218.1 phenazine biosynthesis protein PhzF family [Cupriavidus plantarum]
MATYAYRIVNVFAESILAGNPLCVFEDARGMDDATMQGLALQFNLSETTFLLPSEVATRRVRIFTPNFEMPFAGHPTLGTAHVLRDIAGGGDALSLEVKAGVVPVTAGTGADNDRWTLTAPHEGAPRTAPAGAPDALIASLLGLDVSDLAGSPMWVDTGSEQLMVPLRSTEAVRRARPDGGRFEQWPQSPSTGRRCAYVFAPDVQTPGKMLVRFFFTKNAGSFAEDPGTGSACANLGGWLLATGHALPAFYKVDQGEAVDRPCRLELAVTADGAIRVGGRVIELGRGTVTL